MKKLMKMSVILSGVVLCILLAILLWPPLGMFMLIVAGRAPDCSIQGAVRAVQRRYLYTAAARRMTQQGRIIVREKDGYVLMETPNGRLWEPVSSNGSVALAQIAEIQAKYSTNAPRPVHKGDIVLDCGANIGVFTLEALNSGASLVVAIEPVPENLECIRRNLREQIASHKVMVYPKGVWDKEEVLTLNESDSSSAEHSFVRKEKTHVGPALPLTTIDILVSELKLKRVDFIKLDVEGAEPKALLGAQQTLAKFKPRLEIESSGNAKEILDITKRAWPNYRSECLTCNLDSARMIIYPTLLNLYP